MATACQTFYDQDYLDLNPDVAKAGMNPREHWNNHGRREKDSLGYFQRKFNKQCTTPQKIEPIEFKTGASTSVVEPVKKVIQKVVVTFSDGTTETVE